MTAEPLDGFEDFWRRYPRRTAKGAARKAWTRAMTLTTADSIIEAVESQKRAGMFSDDPHFIPHPATWINSERWSDEIVPRRRFQNAAVELLAREFAMDQTEPLRIGGDD